MKSGWISAAQTSKVVPPMSTISQKLPALLFALTERIQHSAKAVATATILFSIICLVFALMNLGVNTQTNEMFSEELPWFQNFNEFSDEFPVLDRNVLVVIDGESAESVEQAQELLADRLTSKADQYGEVLSLETSEFFQTNGLLFQSEEELEDLGDQLAAMQPVIGRLNQQPHLAGFFSLLVDSLENGSNDSEELNRAMARVTQAFDEAITNEPKTISWQALFTNDDSATEETGESDTAEIFRRIIVVVPELEFEGAEPRRIVLDGIRDEAASLSLSEQFGVTTRLTGGLALEQEELATVADGIIQGAIATVLLVFVILAVTFRSGRLLTASFITLLCGLSLAAAFAAVFIGHINLISVAFIILYIGLGIDFAIHYCLRYRELMAHGESHAQALKEASSDTGSALVLCAFTSSIGFLAFVPTPFSGVAELGLIAGFGMFASLFTTLILLPALMFMMGPPRNSMVQHTPPLFKTIGEFTHHHMMFVRIGVVVLAIFAIVVGMGARFDSNPLNLRDPDSESVMAYIDLLENSESPPLTLNALSDAQDAEELVEKLLLLSEVSEVRLVTSFVPEAQQEKLFILDDFTLLMGLPEAIVLDEVNLERDLAAIRQALPLLLGSAEPVENALGNSIQSWLNSLDSSGQGLESVTLISDAILHNLPVTWNRIVNGFNASEFSIEDLPDDIQRLWLTDEGRYRLEIVSAVPLLSMDEIAVFVEAVQTVTPAATGQPVMQYNAGGTVVSAFTQAISTAVICVLILLLVLLRNIRHTLAVIIPLLLATGLTAAIVALMDYPFNFANVITLPLLIGVGVDNGIHMVKRYQHSGRSDAIMASSTARAILFSTITTICSFGTLAFSNHPGTASMGVVLAIGMSASLLMALFVVPAILPKTAKG